MGQIVFNPAASLNKVQTIAIVLFNAGGYCKAIGVKDNIFSREANIIDQHVVTALAYLLAALNVIGLTIFIKGHHHNRSTVLFTQLGFFDKLRFAFFKANGIDHRLTLNTFQASFNHFPFRGVDHNRHARNIGLARNQIQKLNHGRQRLEHAFVHVDIDNLRAVNDLLTGDF